MYLDIRKGKDPRYYIMQGFRKKEGGTSSRVYLKLGKASEIMEKYGCTDAGLASIDNRLYNTMEGRNYIVTQSIPQLL